ncbi:MAG: globin [Gammaproteobacteria bacterium]|nr:globin [Gammaproteobacteria bacterium]
MDDFQLIQLSLEQSADALGDPTAAVFAHMYQRFPALNHFRSEDSSWEQYMMQEILTNLLQFADDPDSAMNTIRDMTSHHRLIGLPLDVFKGMYRTLFELFSPAFAGEQREGMVRAWERLLQRIDSCVDNCPP